MSIFRRLTGKHDASIKSSGSSSEVLTTSGGAREHARTSIDLVKQGQTSALLEKLIADGPPALMEQNEHKQSLLHIAAEYGHKPIVKLLLLHSAMGIDMVDTHGNTPLLLAALHKRTEVCDLLLRKHANVKHVNADGVTMLHCLARHIFSEAMRVLLDSVIELGADKEAKDKFGESPLQRACGALNLEMAGWFLAKDVDINSTNQFGETVLHKATRMLHADEDKAMKLIDMLLLKGANPDIAGNNGTALEVASKKNSCPQLQEMFTKAKERRVEKQQKLLAINKQGSRLVDLPADWASRDSKQKSAYLLGKWGTLKRNSQDPLTAAAAARSPAVEITISEPPEATEEEVVATAEPEDKSNLSATLLIAEAEKKENIRNSADNNLLTVSSTGGPPSPSGTPICTHAEPYRVEDGYPRSDRQVTPRALVLDFPPEPYKKTYVQQKHWNYVGYLNVAGEDKKEPAAISILMRINEELGFTSCAALIRTQLGVVELPVRPPATIAPAELLGALMSDKTRFTGNAHFTHVDSPDLLFEFLEYEKNDPQRCTCLPVGVIYIPRPGMSHLEVWDSSNQTSDAFEQFLNLLGDRITLQGWSGYAGGLDTVYDKKGKFSVYTRWRGLEIMFHVSTLLPYNAADHAKVQIARVIGNDITNIVFMDSEGAYNPTTFNSAVTHVYGVVHPTQQGYRTAIASKAFVPKFGPDLPPEISKELFKDHFLTKIVNGHFASQRSKGLNMMYSRPREVLLRALVEQFDPANHAVAAAVPERRLSDQKKDKKDKKEEKEAEKQREKDRLLVSQKLRAERRKSVEAVNSQPLKQLLAEAQKEKDREKAEREKVGSIVGGRRNSPAQGRPERRMSEQPGESGSPEAAASASGSGIGSGIVTNLKASQALSPSSSAPVPTGSFALGGSRSDTNVGTSPKK